MMDSFDYLVAAAVPKSVIPCQFGEWEISKNHLPIERMINERDEFTCLRKKIRPEASYENLHLFTGDTNDEFIWDVVMEDSPQELSKHLPIWMNGYGHVLKTGLGLGCVVRGLLQNNEVDQVSVIEIDKDIIEKIGKEFKNNKKVNIYHGDALNFNYSKIGKIDCAWHDIWTPENKGLQELHAQLLVKFMGIKQGAWAFPRDMKRIYSNKIEGLLK